MDSLGRGDDRAVSTLIGAIFLIGTLVILLSVHQATVVPQQNKAIEFDHSQRVQDDMLDVRNAILSARSTGDTTFAEVKLGTDYPPRMFGLNPPAATGALRTGEPHRIGIRDSGGNTLSGVCAGGDPIETRYLTHTPEYAEYRNAPTVVYENTVLYLNFSGETVLLTNETLVQDTTFNVSPLNGEFSEQGVGAESVEPVPGAVNERTVTGAEIEFPSRLSADTWRTLLSEDMDDIASVSETGDGNITIEGDGTTDFTVACSRTGLNGVPPGGAAATSADPVEPTDVEIRSFTFDSTADTISVEFVNTAGRDTNATEGRAALYYDHTEPTGGQSDVTEVDVEEDVAGAATSATLDILGPTEQFDPEIELPGNDTSTNVRFRFDGDVGNRDFLVVRITFSDDRIGTFFVKTPSGGSGGGGP